MTSFDNKVFWNLRRYGAPLLREGTPGRVLSLEETLSYALELSRRYWAVARVWVVVFAKNRHAVNLRKLELLSRRCGQRRTLGFFLTLARELSNDPSVREVEKRLAEDLDQQPEDFSLVPCGELAQELAEKRTPQEAMKWGFRMNAPFEFFETCFQKSMRHHEPVSK